MVSPETEGGGFCWRELRDRRVQLAWDSGLVERIMGDFGYIG